MNSVSFNARVSRDLAEILTHYETESGIPLADDFFDRLSKKVVQAKTNPERFPFFEQSIRRANLDGFPYHFLYRVKSGGIHIFV